MATTTRPPIQHHKHGNDVQPVTPGTRHDSMQHELPTTDTASAHQQRPAAPQNGYAAINQGAMDHSSHDMSDLSMAQTMEREMRTRFLVALPLTLLTVLYSPLGESILGFMPPTFGIPMNLLMVLLATPVVFYSGWMFLSGAYHSLRRRALNMSVLVATGVLAAYVGSLVLMLWGGEVFFEAAAMLVTFVLFGHWMEMRSRRGMNDAMRALTCWRSRSRRAYFTRPTASRSGPSGQRS